MTYSTEVTNPELAIVCCQHGDEVFGKDVFDYFADEADSYPSVLPIFANPRAYQEGKMFIDTNLNRSYGLPEDQSGHEVEIAPAVLSQAKRAPLLLDIHTTVADIEVLSITTNLGQGVQFILSHVFSDVVALIQSREASRSLIGNHGSGVSLEFNEDFAKDEDGLTIVREVVDGIISRAVGDHLAKRVFDVIEILDMSTNVPETAINGEYLDRLGGYILMPRASDYKGFLARTQTELQIVTR